MCVLFEYIYTRRPHCRGHPINYGSPHEDVWAQKWLHVYDLPIWRGHHELPRVNRKYKREGEEKKQLIIVGGKRTQFILTQRGQINTAKEHCHLESGNDRARRLHHLLLEALNDSLETNLSTLPLYTSPLSIGISPQPSICYQRYFQF